MSNSIPSEVLNHLNSFNTTSLFKKELDAYNLLLKQYQSDVIIDALRSIKQNGIPPHGKLCLYPLAYLWENNQIMNLFISNAVIENSQSQKSAINAEATLS